MTLMYNLNAIFCDILRYLAHIASNTDLLLMKENNP